jgi:hypothetical protein
MKSDPMDTKLVIRRGARRLAILFAISLVLVFTGSEVAYIFQKEAYDRAPQVVELIIPAGTADLIANGKAVPTSIPEEMIFVVGDTLVVHNEDSADHVLGPVWVPAGTSASLVMEKASRFAYECSFQSSNYLGLDVRQPTTWGTRLTALALAAPATTVFLFVYSLVIFPIRARYEAGDTLKKPVGSENPLGS